MPLLEGVPEGVADGPDRAPIFVAAVPVHVVIGIPGEEDAAGKRVGQAFHDLIGEAQVDLPPEVGALIPRGPCVVAVPVGGMPVGRPLIERVGARSNGIGPLGPDNRGVDREFFHREDLEIELDRGQVLGGGVGARSEVDRVDPGVAAAI